MIRIPSNVAKFAIAALVGAASLLGAGVASASPSWSVGVALPGLSVGVVEPGHYYQGAPVYRPAPPVAYVPAPPVVRPAPVYYAPEPVLYEAPRRWDDRGRWERREDWRHDRREWERHEERRDWNERR